MQNPGTLALVATLAVHLVLGVIAFLLSFDSEKSLRPSFIEVTLGEYETGSTVARSALDRRSESPVPLPVQEQLERTEAPVEKPVELSRQREPIASDEVIQTPVSDKLDPTSQPESTQPEVRVTPVSTAQEDTRGQEEASGGNPTGTEGRMDAVQGTGNDDELSSPYNLRWDGALGRDPQIQPLPVNMTNVEAIITFRFEVYPDGSIGRVLPLKKVNPELEREVMRTLRGWRFSRLPGTVPQEPQWGTITFRFVVE